MADLKIACRHDRKPAAPLRASWHLIETGIVSDPISAGADASAQARLERADMH
ncbi:hypothetical protein V5F77_08960 [Xanthobacter sp. DSM 24535]|uniref:hypothetical protein n=1 Tax=Roseixanthobacter psychrophilus TaxID=3119917 RepID=UPI0037281FBF